MLKKNLFLYSLLGLYTLLFLFIIILISRESLYLFLSYSDECSTTINESSSLDNNLNMESDEDGNSSQKRITSSENNLSSSSSNRVNNDSNTGGVNYMYTDDFYTGADLYNISNNTQSEAVDTHQLYQQLILDWISNLPSDAVESILTAMSNEPIPAYEFLEPPQFNLFLGHINVSDIPTIYKELVICDMLKGDPETIPLYDYVHAVSQSIHADLNHLESICANHKDLAFLVVRDKSDLYLDTHSSLGIEIVFKYYSVYTDLVPYFNWYISEFLKDTGINSET